MMFPIVREIHGISGEVWVAWYEDAYNAVAGHAAIAAHKEGVVVKASPWLVTGTEVREFTIAVNQAWDVVRRLRYHVEFDYYLREES